MENGHWHRNVIVKNKKKNEPSVTLVGASNGRQEYEWTNGRK